ncbi:HIT family protein [Lichenifustis flavocetrariae]|uniref:HIT domain-containing protein n=1 Tax=Lichenifustis flavocetrariae TaxID=2949735 RepID=A0AA42CK37_9HYPH|nr:HIT domain-containing protein [Lichenifustis flavocetrariae]MCW6508791.1 HIT domain-containing protein [Lichenifustis flavocetrariae]
MTDSYDPSNIFAKILRREIPCHKVFEDEVALAFMDIMPRCDGHCLVIPKAPARTLLDIAPDALSQLITRVQRVAKAAVAATEADGLTLQQFSEAAGGQEVFHLHFHILPRRHGVALRPPAGPVADHATLARQAEAIRAMLVA